MSWSRGLVLWAMRLKSWIMMVWIWMLGKKARVRSRRSGMAIVVIGQEAGVAAEAMRGGGAGAGARATNATTDAAEAAATTDMKEGGVTVGTVMRGGEATAAEAARGRGQDHAQEVERLSAYRVFTISSATLRQLDTYHITLCYERIGASIPSCTISCRQCRQRPQP